jgi:site-specific DNA-methyltransferase (adenine-specific)
MRQLIAAELRRAPDLSDNWLAQTLGTTNKSVAAVREQLISTSEIPKLDALRGKDGKYRRVTRIMTNTAKEAERAQNALRYLGDKAPRKDLELRLVERQVKRVQKLERTKGREVQTPGEGDIRLYHCPFQRLEEVAGIKPGSVNLILTDIPYGQEFLPEVTELAAVASRVLVEGGLLVTYTGQFWLHKVLPALSTCLQYRWCNASVWYSPIRYQRLLAVWNSNSENGTRIDRGYFPGIMQPLISPDVADRRTRAWNKTHNHHAAWLINDSTVAPRVIVDPKRWTTQATSIC